MVTTTSIYVCIKDLSLTISSAPHSVAIGHSGQAVPPRVVAQGWLADGVDPISAVGSATGGCGEDAYERVELPPDLPRVPRRLREVFVGGVQILLQRRARDGERGLAVGQRP